MAAFAAMITRKPAQITRETTSSADSLIRFDGSKITRTFLDLNIPIEEFSFDQTAKIFQSQA
jgi:hypothetical protein